MTEGVRGRLAAYTKEFDGFAYNPYLGVDINGDESWGVRGKLAIDISDNAELMLIGDYSEQDRNCCDNLWLGLGGASAPGYVAEYAKFGATIDRNNTTWLDGTETYSNTETWGLSAELNVELENWNFISITAGRGFDLETDQGVDGLPVYAETSQTAPAILVLDTNGASRNGHPQAPELPGGIQSQEQFSQEFRLESTAWENAHLTLGAFYWNQKLDRYFQRVLYLSVAQAPAAYGWMDSSADTESYAFFASGDYQLTEDLTLLAGIRYTHDEISAEIDRTTPAPGVAVAPSAYGYGETTESDVSGRLGLQYNLSDDWMVYATASTGYKSPGFDLIFSATQERLENPVPAEEVTAFELGLKGEFWDGRARVGASIFSTSFDNYQGQGFDSENLQFQLISAGEVTTEGFEADITIKPTPNWLINAGYAYTDAVYESYPGAPCYPGQTADQGCVGGSQDISGNQVANAPKNKFTVQTRYDIDFGGSFMPYIGGSYRHQSESPSDLNGDPRSQREAYGILDLIAGVEAADGTWQAEFFVKNALDDFYVDRPAFDANLGGYNGFLTRDAWRYMGLEFNYRFGAQ